MEKFSVAFKIKVKHGILQKFIEEMGWTQTDFAKAVGMDPTTVCKWFNLGYVPRNKKLINKVCELIGVSKEVLFPAFINSAKFKRIDKEVIIYKDVNVASLTTEMLDKLPAKCEENYEENNIDVDRFRELLEMLTYKEKEILRLKFEENMSYREIGKIFKLSGTRIQQIEYKAKDKLKNKSKQKI